MEDLIKETREGIKELNNLKYKYPRMATTDVIKIMERIEERLKLILPKVSRSKPIEYKANTEGLNTSEFIEKLSNEQRKNGFNFNLEQTIEDKTLS